MGPDADFDLFTRSILLQRHGARKRDTSDGEMVSVNHRALEEVHRGITHKVGDKQVGWLYQNEKSAGSNLLSVISTYIVVRALENGWFSAEFLSLNKAAQNKESESRGHLESLFSYWEKNPR